MTTLTHPREFRFAPAAGTLRSLPLPVSAMRAEGGEGWLDRLVAWADRQPPHHRMGCWVGFR